MYWSSASGEGTSALGVGGVAGGLGGVRGSLSVLVRSTVGLMVGVVSVSGVLSLLFVVLGLVVISAAVECRWCCDVNRAVLVKGLT